MLKSDERRIREALDRHDARVRDAAGADAALAAADDMLRALARLAARHELPVKTDDYFADAALAVYRIASKLAGEIRAELKN